MLYLPVGLLVAAGPAPARLFEAQPDPSLLQSVRIEGFTQPIPATVYAADSLEQGGMPLGGIGTGYVCLDPDGRVSKQSILNTFPAPQAVGRPLFHGTLDGKPFVVATPRDGEGDARCLGYVGHFPLLEARYLLNERIEVEWRAFAPLFPGDAAGSNTPAIVYEVRVANVGGAEAMVELIFAPPGVPTSEQTVPFSEQEPFAGVEEWAGFTVTHPWADNRVVGDRPVMEHSYAVAARDGYVTSLPGGPVVAVKHTLPPGGQAAATFLFAWYQPNLHDGSGVWLRHRYAERFADAGDVMRTAIAEHEQWRDRILRWQAAIYEQPDLPDWLKEALVNGLYPLAKNSSWFARTHDDDWFGAEGLFVQNESFSTCSITNTLPCNFFGQFPALFLFPQLDRLTLAAFAHYQLRDGCPPFCFGLGLGLRDPRYYCQHTSGAGEYAQMILRSFQRTGDREALQQLYPHARDALRYQQSLDTDGDGLVNEQHHAAPNEGFPANNPMDCWPWHGAAAYTAIKGLASLEAGLALAEAVGDREAAEEFRAALSRGQESLERLLWTGEYYRLWADPATGTQDDACLASQLSGVYTARLLGLADPIPADRIAAALDAVSRLNGGKSPFGLVNGVYPDGRICSFPGPVDFARNIFVQANSTTVMVDLYTGDRERGDALARRMFDTFFRGPHRMPWSQACSVDAETGGSNFGYDYFDNMVVWAYPLAYRRQSIAEACGPDGLITRVINAAAPNP